MSIRSQEIRNDITRKLQELFNSLMLPRWVVFDCGVSVHAEQELSEMGVVEAENKLSFQTLYAELSFYLLIFYFENKIKHGV